MTGAIFVIAGIFFIGWGGLNLYNGHLKQRLKGEGFAKKIKDTGGEAGTSNEEILIDLIKMAAADGTISDNEHERIYNKANDLNIDAEIVDAIIREERNKVKGKEEVVIIDKIKQKGDQFEGYIASKFDQRFFKLKEWTGDKIVDGIYAESTHHPDLKFLFSMGRAKFEFAVECKFRSQYYNKGIEWATDKQFKNYQEFEKKHTPVFVAMGVGGNPSDPDELFIIPLKEIKHKYVSIFFLKKFQKRKSNNNMFYLDHKNLTLS